MSEPKWSKGPWHVDASEDSHGFHNYTINGRGNREEREANANLISAAPELYRELEKAMPWIGDVSKRLTILNVLAKARGEL